MAKFAELISKNGNELLKARANDLEETARLNQEDLVRGIEKRINKLKLRLRGLIDLGPETTDSLRHSVDADWDAEGWVAEVQNVKLELMDAKEELALAKETMKELFEEGKTICNRGTVESNDVIKKMVEYFGLKYFYYTDSYDCDGDVDLYEYYKCLNANEQMEFDNTFVIDGRMAIKFGTVKGDFVLPGDSYHPYILTSLEGCPEKVGGDFSCAYNQLTSLEGCPESVGGYFSCCNNKTKFIKEDVREVCNVKKKIYV